MEQLEKNAAEFPDRQALCLDSEKPVTYGELWNLSGKVYAWLKGRGIGKEDFVLINLPRGPEVVIANIGIWRAGAACTVTEQGYPAERVEYIRKDCNAKIFIDEAAFREMMAGESKAGYETADPHDACFAVYTSGTTGNPKGVLHEYGKLEIGVRCNRGFRTNVTDICRYAAIFPLNFAAYYIEVFCRLYCGNSIYIISFDTVKNISALTRLLAKERIDEMFMTPSMLKLCQKHLPPSLKCVMVGGEALAEVYMREPQIINSYGSSESSFVIACFCVDKSYKAAPVGKNICGMEIHLLNEQGQEVPEGEQGEICLQNDFFRGYINLPEQTERVLQNGLYHTGDMGYKNENGDLVVCGRSDDMIKIDGNRVEPAEIEGVAREILQVENIMAKGFSGGNAFIALYGLTGEIGDRFDGGKIAGLREKFSQRLPRYMIPTYYITLEKFPMNANGKVSRRLLPPPNRDEETVEYVPPATETEALLCEKMKEILGIGRIGRHDDFYQRGGDSLKTIMLVTECQQLDFSSSDVYKYRTPEKLAAFCDKNRGSSQSGEKFSPARAMEEKFFPNMEKAYQKYLETGTIASIYSVCFAIDEDSMRKVSLNPYVDICLREEVDPARLQAAVDRAVEVCPYASFEISKREGLVYFRKSRKPFVIHKLGTIKELGGEENNQHYALVEFEKEMLRFTVSHILSDGYGISCFGRAVMDFYFGKDKTLYNGADKPDFTADLMGEELPLPKGYEPKSYHVKDRFIPPEKAGAEKDKSYRFSMEIPAGAYYDFCSRYGVSAQIAVSLLLAEAVQKAHPGNRKIISVRGPVNTRIPLQVPNTFQNASVPHIFLNVDPKQLQGDYGQEMIEQLSRDFSEQYSYENLAAFTNWTRGFVMAETPEERMAIGAAYKNRTDVFANFMGKVMDDDVMRHIKSYEQNVPASYPLMLYALDYGDVMGFQMMQSFASTAYKESLLQVLTDRLQSVPVESRK